MSDPLVQKLGFRIDVRSDGQAGTVIWTASDIGAGVRPATGVELKLWKALQVLRAEAEDDHDFNCPDEAENPDW